jgi:hypothetical protein
MMGKIDRWFPRSARIIPAVVLLLATSAVARAASVPFVNLDPATDLSQNPGPGQYYGFTDTNVDGTIGWSFSITEPVVVTELGWYDDGQDGLSHAHFVGISTALNPSPSNALVSTTIPDGTQASLDGSWRVEPIGPVTLNPGSYSLVGWDYTAAADPLKFAGGGGPLPLDPRIDSFGTTPISGPYSGATTDLLVTGVWLGPMMFVQPAPEPGTLALAVASLLSATAFVIGRRWSLARCRRRPAAARR